jgi:hypothetical protein
MASTHAITVDPAEWVRPIILHARTGVPMSTFDNLSKPSRALRLDESHKTHLVEGYHYKYDALKRKIFHRERVEKWLAGENSH